MNSNNHSETISVNNSDLSLISNARSKGCDLTQKISISLTTDNLINKIFDNRNHRMRASMENSVTPRSGS